MYVGKLWRARKGRIESLEAHIASLIELRTPDCLDFAELQTKIDDTQRNLSETFDFLAKDAIISRNKLFYENYENNTRFFHSISRPTRSLKPYPLEIILDTGVMLSDPASILHA